MNPKASVKSDKLLFTRSLKSIRFLSWTHHLEILKRCRSPEEKLFYLVLCTRERYTVRELVRQVKSSLFERQMLAKHSLILQ